VTFYRPRVAWINSWPIAAVPGDPLFRSVSIPPLSTTQAALVMVFTAATVIDSAVQDTGRGSYFSSTDVELCRVTANATDTIFPPMPGDPYRSAISSMVGAATEIDASEPLAPYLASGLRYDFSLGVTQHPDPIVTYINGVLTIMVVDGPVSATPSATQAAVGDPSHYNYATGAGSSTGSVDIWLDPFYSHHVHAVCCWGAQASGVPAGNWWSAGDAFQPAVHGVTSVYQSLAVSANDPTSASAIDSPISYALDTSERWAIMAWQSDLVPAPYVPPVAVPSKLATIVG